jgi:ketosteroid isomerase-like protein
MRIRPILLAGALLAPFAASEARAQTVPVPYNNAAEGRQRFRAEAMREAMILLGDWRAAWESHDARALARLYHNNALLLLPGRVAPLQGRAAIEEALRTELPRLGGIQFRLVDSEAGDQMLYLFQEFTIAPGEGASGAAPAANGGLVGITTILMERDGGGGFKIRAQTFQLDPQAAAEAPRQAAAVSDSTD